ncbi:hypothetical protein OIU78_017820 [Salix suchowensis]|nr:hypothetical protein OIU78_017820 [Salix suchowensis]
MRMSNLDNTLQIIFFHFILATASATCKDNNHHVRRSLHKYEMRLYNYHQKFIAINNTIMEFKEGITNGSHWHVRNATHKRNNFPLPVKFHVQKIIKQH